MVHSGGWKATLRFGTGIEDEYQRMQPPRTHLMTPGDGNIAAPRVLTTLE